MIDYLIPLYEDSAHFAARVDPRVKIILLFLFIITILMIPFNQPVKLAACTILSVIILLLTHIPLNRLLRSLIKIYPMILLISLIQLLNAGPSTVLKPVNGFFNLQTDAMWTVIGFQVKSLLVISAGFIFIFTTPFTRLINSLNKMRLPAPVVSVSFFIYHFIFILARELNRIHTVLRSRYIKLSLLKRISLLKKVIIMYFMRLFDSSERLNQLLLSRGFSGKFYFHAPLIWQKTDSLTLISGIVVLITISFIT